MAMIRITNGKDVTTVSHQTYENKFRKNGWHEMRETQRRRYEPMEPDREEDIDTIPVSDMTQDQLKRYAKEHNIDISRTKSAAEARKVIQTAIRNKNM